jgi:PadR family transcriptional regulator, regulatory protein PadR
MRRKKGVLLPIEFSILEVCRSRSISEEPETHGFLIASLVKSRQNARLLTAYGTLYRALNRLEKAGYLASRWEDISLLTGTSRPRRRLYHITEIGRKALADGASAEVDVSTAFQFGQMPERGIA